MSKKKTICLYLLTISISAITFFSIYGLQIINPTYDDWLMNSGGDLSQHYVGWVAFRNAPWTFPIGNFNSLTYPTSISVLFADCIPLFAIFFKLLSPVLPKTFQYMGLFGFSSYVMMGVLAVTLIKKYSSNIAYILLAAEFFLLSPQMMQRFYGHEALGGGQWIILLAFATLVYYEERFQHMKAAIGIWILIAFLGVTIHMYFAAMALIVLLGFCIYDYLHRKDFKRIFILLASYGCTLFITIFILGALGNHSLSADGFGAFSSNLNTLVNSLGYSRLLPALPSLQWQYEGFGYLGVGILLLSVITLISLFMHYRELNSSKKKFLSFLAISLMALIYALSSTVTLGYDVLYTIPLPEYIERICSIFRASGRFIWILVYCIYLGIFVVLAKVVRSYKNMIPVVLLLITLLAQIYDLSPMILGHHSSYSQTSTYTDPFEEDPVLRYIVEENDIKHLSLADYRDDVFGYEIGYYAVNHGLTIDEYNTVHGVGRADKDQRIKTQLENDSGDTLYIFEGSNASYCEELGLFGYEISNNLIAGYTKEIKGLK